MAGMLVTALVAPSTALAAGPGNNGLDPTGNGTTSNATVGGSLSAAGGSATMGSAVMYCSSDNVGSVGGSFTLSKTLDVGSTITIYLVPNTGSDASPAGNVTKNEAMITFGNSNRASGTVIPWTINVTHAFTATSGGILGVFAKNADDTAISSSKTNSLNCTEAQPTATPTEAPTATPTEAPTATPTEAPTATPTEAPTATPTEAPTATPTEAPTATPTEAPTATPTEAPTATPTEAPTATPTEAPTATPTPTPVGSVEAATGTPTPTPTPVGSVEAATGTPNITPPPTDALTSTPSGPDGSWRLALIGMAGILAAALLLTPAPATRRNRKR